MATVMLLSLVVLLVVVVAVIVIVGNSGHSNSHRHNGNSNSNSNSNRNFICSCLSTICTVAYLRVNRGNNSNTSATSLLAFPRSFPALEDAALAASPYPSLVLAFFALTAEDDMLSMSNLFLLSIRMLKSGRVFLNWCSWRWPCHDLRSRAAGAMPKCLAKSKAAAFLRWVVVRQCWGGHSLVLSWLASVYA